MQRGRVRYRWDRIAGVGGTLVLLCFLLVAWISPDEPEAEPELEHPGEADLVPQIGPSAAVPQQEPERPEPEPEVEAEEEVLPCSCNKGVLRLPKNPYTAHQQAARNLPNSFFVKDKSELRAGKSRGNLVDVTDGRGYHIAPLSHSHAMLLPDVKSLLEDMGHAFARGDEERGDYLPSDEFDANGTATSLARAPQLQRHRRRVYAQLWRFV